MAIALVDSGSDASFINAKFAIKNHCRVSTIPDVQVAAVNGLKMLSTSVCLSCQFNIQGSKFSSDFILLKCKDMM